MANEAEAALIAGETMDAFANFRRLAKATKPISTPILDANGTLINDKSQKLEYWRNYYVELLNQSTAPVSEELLSTAQAATADPTIDCSEPTTQEVINNLNTTKNGKTPGICNIIPEMMKAGGIDCSI